MTTLRTMLLIALSFAVTAILMIAQTCLVEAAVSH